MYKNRYYDSSISCSFSDVVDLWAIFASREQDKILAATCWKRDLVEGMWKWDISYNTIDSKSTIKWSPSSARTVTPLWEKNKCKDTLGVATLQQWSASTAVRHFTGMITRVTWHASASSKSTGANMLLIKTSPSRNKHIMEGTPTKWRRSRNKRRTNKFRISITKNNNRNNNRKMDGLDGRNRSKQSSRTLAESTDNSLWRDSENCTKARMVSPFPKRKCKRLWMTKWGR